MELNEAVLGEEHMLLSKNTSKEIREFLIIIVLMIAMAIGSNLMNTDAGQSLGILFVFGLPTVVFIVGFVKGRKNNPHAPYITTGQAALLRRKRE